MKIGYCCIIVLFLPTFLLAQNFEYIAPPKYTDYRSIAAFEPGFVAGGSKGRCKSSFLTFFDTDGNIQWAIQPFGAGRSWIAKVLVDPSDHILVAGPWSEAIDYFTPEDGAIFQKITASGDVVFSAKLSGFNDYEHDNYEHSMMMLPDSSYFWGFGQRLTHISRTGDSLDQQAVFDYLVQDLVLYEDSLVIAATEFSIQVLDLGGNALQTYGTNDRIKDMIKADQEIWAVTNQDLLRYSVASNTVDIFPLEAISVPIGLIADATGLLVWNQQRAVHFNGDIWELRYEQDVHPLTLRAISYDNGRYYLTGRDYLAWGPPEVATITNLQVPQSYIQVLTDLDHNIVYPGTDIGVTNIYVSKNTFIDTAKIYTPTHQLMRINVFADVEVTNFGTDTVSSFTLSSAQMGYFNCAESRVFELVEDIELLPNETHLVPIAYSTVYDQRPTTGIVEVSTCFSTGAPNNHLDANFANNSFCAILVTDIEDPPLATHEVVLFPVPAKHTVQLQVNGITHIDGLRLLDLHGRTVWTNQQAITLPYDIPRNHLPAGSYFLQIQSGQTILTKKLVWVN